MRLLLACLLPLAAATAPAQTEVLPPVKTELKRDAGVLPYAQINSVLRKLAQHGEGQFRMDFRVEVAKTLVPLANMRLVVRSDEADYPLKLDADGRFDLPMLPEAEARTADFATNVRRGQMPVRGTLELTVAPEQLDMARVRQIMRVARALREELLPWYLRWLFPRIEGVRVCSATPTWELEWREDGKPGGQLLGLPLPQAPGEFDPAAKKAERGRPCTVLTGQESWPDAARLLPPPDTRLSVRLQGK